MNFNANQIAATIYSLRRQRDAACRVTGLFGEPAWDILLDVFIAASQGRDTHVSSVCIDAGVPATTVLRWIARLEREGLIYREDDSADARRRYVRLTADGTLMMEHILAKIGGPFLIQAVTSPLRK